MTSVATILCSVGGCASPVFTKKSGYCQKHYQRVRATGSALKAERVSRVVGPCSVDGCEKGIYTATSGLCKTHYSRMRKTGKLTIARESPTKVCTKCGESKPRNAFYIRKERDGGQIKSECKPCARAKAKAFRANNPEYMTTWNANNAMKKSDWHRFRQYGITPDEYQAMFDKQRGRCAICGNDMGAGNVDHDHLTGAVRELLCHPCNIALGMFRDDPSRVTAALEYLKRHSA